MTDTDQMLDQLHRGIEQDRLLRAIESATEWLTTVDRHMTTSEICHSHGRIEIIVRDLVRTIERLAGER